jgi:hypothetical protein
LINPKKLGAGPFAGATGIPTKSPAKDGAELGNETVQRLHRNHSTRRSRQTNRACGEMLHAVKVV